MDAGTEGGSVLKAAKEDILKVFDSNFGQEPPRSSGVRLGATKCALYVEERESETDTSKYNQVQPVKVNQERGVLKRLEPSRTC